MNRAAVLISALVVVIIGLLNVVLGRNLIMPLALAEERGAGVPWYLVWGMIMITMLSALALGGFLVSSLRDSRR
jgi:hypothetical protein